LISLVCRFRRSLGRTPERRRAAPAEQSSDDNNCPAPAAHRKRFSWSSSAAAGSADAFVRPVSQLHARERHKAQAAGSADDGPIEAGRRQADRSKVTSGCDDDAAKRTIIAIEEERPGCVLSLLLLLLLLSLSWLLLLLLLLLLLSLQLLLLPRRRINRSALGGSHAAA
jgi:hypothetical protein